MAQTTSIVDLYPTKIMNRAELLADGLRGDSCILWITGRRFTRTIYHPPEGPDILMAQSRGEITYQYFRELELSAMSSRLHLYNAILEYEAEITDERLFDDRNSNPAWTWSNVASGVSQYVEEKGFFLEGKQPEGCMIEADEAFGTLTTINSQWNHIPPSRPIRKVRDCVNCLQRMTDNDSIALHCQHVYHKKCFLPRLWVDPQMTCWTCRAPLLLS